MPVAMRNINKVYVKDRGKHRLAIEDSVLKIGGDNLVRKSDSLRGVKT
jgi:hypothetical protein